MLLARLISHTGTQYIDFVDIFNISLALPAIYFAHFSVCGASSVYSYHSILECFNLLSGVKLRIRSFFIFIILMIAKQLERVITNFNRLLGQTKT